MSYLTGINLLRIIGAIVYCASTSWVVLMDSLIGQKLGDFTIIERIGQGGAAVVYRAEQPAMKREVALKVINVIEASQHGDFYKRFEREAAVIASLEHAHILPVHDYGIQGNWAYMAMRYLRGGSLKDILRAEQLPLDRVLDLFAQVAGGLAYAHSKGIIHRDIKPANIMLDEEGNAYLTDFGLAKMVKGEQESTQSGQIVGTITNMAPEQLRGEPLDHRADLYALGIVLYEMSVGETPFKTDNKSDIISLIYKHLEEDPAPPSTYDANIPPELEATILRAIAKRPDQRFDSAAAMLESLAPLRTQLSSSAITLPAVDAELLKIARHTDSTIQTEIGANNKNPILIVSIVAVLIIALFVGLIVMNDLSSRPQPRQPHSVQSGVSATSSEIVPTIDEIESAKQALGEDGFVGIIACNLSSEYHATLNREIGSFLLEQGISRKVYDSENEAYDQIPILEQALAEGAQGIILCPLDYSLLDAPLETIEANNVPFVLLSNEDNLYGGVRLSGNEDNYSMGLTVGEFAGELIQDELDGEAKVVILDFPDMPIIVERADGLEDGLLSVAPSAEVVGRYIGALEDNGRESIEQLLEDDIDFDVILSINDAGSYGAIVALEEADIAQDAVMIASIDAERKAVDYMREGRFIRGSLSVGRQEMALTSANVMIKMLAGGVIPESIIIESGDMVTPETLIEN